MRFHNDPVCKRTRIPSRGSVCSWTVNQCWLPDSHEKVIEAVLTLVKLNLVRATEKEIIMYVVIDDSMLVEERFDLRFKVLFSNNSEGSICQVLEDREHYTLHKWER